MTDSPRIVVVGTRGIPARHGGFETFAEYLALDLAGRGWGVTVYCQESGDGPIVEDAWHGVRLVHVPVAAQGPLGTIIFDLRSIWHARGRDAVVLTLGYNTAVLSIVWRLRGAVNVMNMDGVEWRREKWSFPAKAWLWLNEYAGALFADHLVADHPQIAAHLGRHTRAAKITTIPYGADRVGDVPADPVVARGLEPGGYALSVARTEPENSILEIVSAFARRPRGIRLAILGGHDDRHPYHRAVKAAAGPETRFLGAIYDRAVVQALRRHARVYVHGHRVGGTNPSLVEALGAGTPVIAHDNPFNRWVAGEGARYFTGADDCAALFDSLLDDPATLARMREASTARHAEAFTWEKILGDYRHLLEAQAARIRPR